MASSASRKELRSRGKLHDVHGVGEEPGAVPWLDLLQAEEEGEERGEAKEGRKESRARDRGLVSSGWSPTLGGRERGSLGAAAFVTDGGELWLKEKAEVLRNREVRWFKVEAHSRSSGGREMIPRWEEEAAGFGGSGGGRWS